jgi:RNA recognition motif-containing protein
MWDAELKELGSAEHSGDIFSSINEDISKLFTRDPYKERNVKVIKDELYLGNLHQDLQYEELIQFLSSFGEVEFLNIIVNDKGKALGFAYAKFKNSAIHDKLLSQSNYYSLKGRKLVISEKIEKVATLEDIERKCWFCLNNPNIDTDLILKEFKEFYLAYPKGPINNFHFLIIPRRHIKSFIDLKENQQKEYNDILKTLIKLFSDNNLDYAIYEKNLAYKDEISKHLIMNIIGIDKELSFNLLDLAGEILQNDNVKFKEFDSSIELNKITDRKSYYFYIDIPSGIQFGRSGLRTRVFVELTDSKKPFFTDYPRTIICNLLDKEERINWKVNFFVKLECRN